MRKTKGGKREKKTQIGFLANERKINNNFYSSELGNVAHAERTEREREKLEIEQIS